MYYYIFVNIHLVLYILIMTSFPVLVAGHSQAKYFGKYFSLTDTDVLSYSGFRIDQMFQKLQPTVRNYNTIVLHIGANDVSRALPVKTVINNSQVPPGTTTQLRTSLSPVFYQDPLTSSQGHYHAPISCTISTRELTYLTTA